MGLDLPDPWTGLIDDRATFAALFWPAQAAGSFVPAAI
jgi:hypothetical protein